MQYSSYPFSCVQEESGSDSQAGYSIHRYQASRSLTNYIIR